MTTITHEKYLKSVRLIKRFDKRALRLSNKIFRISKKMRDVDKKIDIAKKKNEVNFGAMVKKKQLETQIRRFQKEINSIKLMCESALNTCAKYKRQ